MNENLNKLNNEYINNLILQFKQATGVKNVDVTSESFICEFSSWVKERNLIIPDYQNYIKQLSAKPYIGDTSVEIDKGQFDSIAIDSDVSIITPFTDGIIKTNGSLINGDFFVYEGIPIVVSEKDERLETFTCKDFYRFITQNPYNPRDLANWEELHNTGNNITVGVYGSIHDKDISSKLKLMKEFESKLSSGFVCDYTTKEDNYMCVVSSDRKELERVRVRQRLRTR